MFDYRLPPEEFGLVISFETIQHGTHPQIAGLVRKAHAALVNGGVALIELPRREFYFTSPADWRDEVLYFLLPDRFSDGKEAGRPLLDVNQRLNARPAGFRFDDWAKSGGSRYQGGTIAAISSKLQYLQDLGITTLWIGPVFKQRTHWDDYHGYAIQDFLAIERVHLG